MWFALVGPSDPTQLAPAAFLRIPVEALVAVALVLVLPPRAGRVLAALCGALLGLLTVVKLLDTGFRSALGRPFNPVSDWRYAGSFVDLLGGSLGRAMAGVVGIGLAVLVVALLVTVPLAVRRLTRLAGRDRAVTYRFVGAFGAIWLVGATVGLQVAPGEPLAAADAAGLAYQQVATIRSGLADRSAFADQLAVPAASVPAALTRLRGKDVVFAFVESYGRVAVEDPPDLTGGGRGPGQRHRSADRGRVHEPERVSHLADVRRDQLAGPFHRAVGPVGGQPAAVRPADGQ